MYLTELILCNLICSSVQDVEKIFEWNRIEHMNTVVYQTEFKIYSNTISDFQDSKESALSFSSILWLFGIDIDLEIKVS